MIVFKIDFYNCKKNFQLDTIEFKGDDWETTNNKARKWGKENLDNFHEDMIKIVD